MFCPAGWRCFVQESNEDIIIVDGRELRYGPPTTMIFTLLSPIIFSHFLQNRAFSAISFVHSLQNRAFYAISNFLHDYFAFTFRIFVYLLIRNFLLNKTNSSQNWQKRNSRSWREVQVRISASWKSSFPNQVCPQESTDNGDKCCYEGGGIHHNQGRWK